jgi:hypothetical protein
MDGWMHGWIDGLMDGLMYRLFDNKPCLKFLQGGVWET